jgi:3-oxo-5-alpha-steroid 4-dehydrogenase 3
MTFEQVKITWLLLLVQGCRRLYESLSLSKEDIFSVENDSASQMWGGHWLVGLAFYFATSIAVWIEGLPALEDHTLSYRDLIFKAPTMRTIFGVLIFMLASGFQHDCHAYLAYLKASKSTPENPAERAPASSPGKKDTAVAKTAAVGTGEGEYKLPTHPAFQPLVCPHYMAECLIYLSLAIVAAPQGSWMNWTLACAFVFVTVNLGVTAEGTRKWYEKRFGPEAVDGKWRMVPMVW